ncbi:MAG TPA: hypothetical protein VF508_12890, partial [Pyrinomonadaceae bacterium]
MKQVPNKDAVLRVRGDGKWVEEGDLSFEVNESDGYALEEALRLREKKGGEVVVVTLGPQRAQAVIKDALARGADRGLHIIDAGFGQAGPFAIAKVLAEAVRTESPDLVMTGLQSDDQGFGQTGVIVAELLGL